jgi:hypothetical protein
MTAPRWVSLCQTSCSQRSSIWPTTTAVSGTMGRTAAVPLAGSIQLTEKGDSARIWLCILVLAGCEPGFALHSPRSSTVTPHRRPARLSVREAVNMHVRRLRAAWCAAGAREWSVRHGWMEGKPPATTLSTAWLAAS